MNEFGPKSTLEDLECFAKNRGVAVSLRPPRNNSPLWCAIFKDRYNMTESIGFGDQAWIAIDNAAKKIK